VQRRRRRRRCERSKGPNDAFVLALGDFFFSFSLSFLILTNPFIEYLGSNVTWR
jgi:hypothetical protein